MSEPGVDLREDGDKWVLDTLGPSGVTTTTFESKEDAEAAIESHRETVADATKES